MSTPRRNWTSSRARRVIKGRIRMRTVAQQRSNKRSKAPPMADDVGEFSRARSLSSLSPPAGFIGAGIITLAFTMARRWRESAWSEITTAGVVSDATAIGVVVSGVIEAVSCDIGSIVKAGQVCATIDARPYRLIVERGNVDLSIANGRLEKARAQLTRAQAKYERSQNLSKRKAIAPSALELSRKVFEQRQAEVVRAEASVALAQAALDAAQSNLQHTSILSPIEGTVVARSVAVGQAVIAGRSEPLFRVAADPRIVKINVTVDAQVANALQVGDVVSISLEPERDHPLQGKITQISLSPKPTEPTAYYDIVITAANPDLRLKPGMSTTIRITPGGGGTSRRPTTT